MKTVSKQLADLLRSLANAVESMDSAEIEGLTALLRNKPLDRKLKSSGSSPLPRVDASRIEEILSRMRLANSRSQGAEILAENKLTKSELVALAKLGNVHTTKEDNIGRIEEKLIESLIGSRLNSQAIRGDGNKDID